MGDTKRNLDLSEKKFPLSSEEKLLQVAVRMEKSCTCSRRWQPYALAWKAFIYVTTKGGFHCLHDDAVNEWGSHPASEDPAYHQIP